MKQFLFASAVISISMGAVKTSYAESLSFDPNMSCREAFNEKGAITQSYMGMWALGFYAAGSGKTIAVDEKVIALGLKVLRKKCSLNLDGSMVEAMTAAINSAGAPAIALGSEADVRKLLFAFMKQGADTAKLTYALKPTSADVRAVYKEPLASKMVDAYEKLFTPEVKIGPKAGQTDLLTFYSTTDELAAGGPMLDEFPGGYKKVTQYMNPGFPIVRFKFVKPGATLGMASDGLIFVNNRWVFMPKPWRILSQ